MHLEKTHYSGPRLSRVAGAQCCSSEIVKLILKEQGRVCTRPCAGRACTPCNPRSSPRARPIQRMGCAVYPTGYSTSPNLPRPTGCGCPTTRTCRWPTEPRPTCTPFRACAPSSDRLACGRERPHPKISSPRPCNGPFFVHPPTPELLVRADRGRTR